MKRLTTLALTAILMQALVAGGNKPAGSVSPTAEQAPQIEWIKNEISSIWATKSFNSGEKLDELLIIDVAKLTQSAVIITKGHFTSTENMQYVLTVPASSIDGKDLGWETNLWMLVEKGDNNNFKTIATMRGDVAYQNSLVDVDFDGLMEISMVNRLSCENGSQKIAYKIYSFKTGNYIYNAETLDKWSCDKENKRKTLKKGDILYNVLQIKHEDTDGDGVLEVVETWITFSYNGGRRVGTIEQKKTMTIQKRILKLQNGTYK